MLLVCRLFAFLVWFALFVCSMFGGKLDKLIVKFTGKSKCLRFSKENLKKPRKTDYNTDMVDVGGAGTGWTERPAGQSAVRRCSVVARWRQTLGPIWATESLRVRRGALTPYI